MLKKAFLVSKSRDLCAINDILVLDISYPLRPQWQLTQEERLEKAKLWQYFYILPRPFENGYFTS